MCNLVFHSNEEQRLRMFESNVVRKVFGSRTVRLTTML
jgi:hypothetical protein